MNFSGKSSAASLSDRRERLISNSPYRGSNPPPQPAGPCLESLPLAIYEMPANSEASVAKSKLPKN
jgi:hypothetical protein